MYILDVVTNIFWMVLYFKKIDLKSVKTIFIEETTIYQVSTFLRK